MTEHCSSLVNVASGTAIFYTTTAPSCCIPASYCHLSATVQTISITFVNLQDNRAMFRIFMALLRFSFGSTSYYFNLTKYVSFVSKLLNVSPLRRCIQLQWSGHTLEPPTVNILGAENNTFDRVVMMVISSNGIAAWASDHVIWESNTVAPRTIKPSPKPWLHEKQKSKLSLRTS